MVRVNKFLVFISLFGVVILSFMFVQGGTTGNVADDIQKAVEGSDWCLGADVNRDGHVGIGDTAFISQYYGKTKCSNANLWCDSTDINKDKSVGIGDFNIMASYYGAYGCCSRAVFGGPCVAGLSCVVELPYDDFSSGVLDGSKWEIRQDLEGQPFPEEYSVKFENSNFVFHTSGQGRVYLFPKRYFTTGDSLEYDVDLISREGGTYAQMILLIGDQSIRIGMRGNDAGFDEIGIAHMKLTFQKNNLAIERKTPSGNILIDNLALTKSDGSYQLYIGSFIDSGRVHMDFDNFYIYN